jgi:putative SOS response-associated peptidase YedK
VCGRYSAWFDDRDLEGLASWLGAELTVPRAERQAASNVAPTTRAPILVGRPTRRIGLARFGWVLPQRSSREPPKRLINVRSETAVRSRTFGESLARRRCAVLADGYYEWLGAPGRKTPYFTRALADVPLFLAGCYEVGRSESDERDPAFVVLTRASEGAVARIHDRMPVLLDGAMLARWIDPDEADVEALVRDVLAAPLPATRTYPVSTRVSSASSTGAELREPVGPDFNE